MLTPNLTCLLGWRNGNECVNEIKKGLSALCDLNLLLPGQVLYHCVVRGLQKLERECMAFLVNKVE